MSMTSDANRRYVLEAWNGVIERVGIRTEMNYLEDQPVYEGDTREEEAREAVKEGLDIKPAKFGYLPEKWKFSNYEIDLQAGLGLFFYTDGENWINFTMKKNEGHTENVTYYQFDQGTNEIGEIVNDQDIQIKIYEDTESGYIAMFEENTDFYSLNARMDYQEFIKILKYIAF